MRGSRAILIGMGPGWEEKGIRMEEKAIDAAEELREALRSERTKRFRELLALSGKDILTFRGPEGKSLLEEALGLERWIEAKALVGKGASLNDPGANGRPLWSELGWGRPSGKENGETRARMARAFWEWGLKARKIDLSARGADGELEVDRQLYPGAGAHWCWGSWIRLERAALAAGLRRSAEDKERLALRALKTGKTSVYALMGALGIDPGERGGDPDAIEEAFGKLSERIREGALAGEEARENLWRLSVELSESLGSRRDRWSERMVRAALDAMPDFVPKLAERDLAGEGCAAGRALAERRAMERAGAQAPAEAGKRRGI